MILAFSFSSASAVVIGLPNLELSRQLAEAYRGVGTLEIEESGGRYRGTGVLLNDHWVLTAAHNWDAEQVRGLGFAIGGQRHEAAEWAQHPGWDGSFSTEQGWDVALVRLANPVTGFGATELYAGSRELGMQVTVLGTGLAGTAGQSLDFNGAGEVFAFTNTIDRVISLGGSAGPGGLLAYDFDNGTSTGNSLASEAVFDAFGQPVFPTPNLLGPGSSTFVTALEGTSALGDSGGPAFADFGNGPELVGLVSWGVNPTEPSDLYGSGYGDVGYLMRVSALEGWINSVVVPEPSASLLSLVTVVIFTWRRGGKVMF